jgi:xanthine dehydrogenase accessory factor
MMAISGEGSYVGSVSGGCVEDDLADKVSKGMFSSNECVTYTYGDSELSQLLNGLPCGGTLEVLIEPILANGWIKDAIHLVSLHSSFLRVLDVSLGKSSITRASRHEEFDYDGQFLRMKIGPVWRLFLVGASDIAKYLCYIAKTLNFDIQVCDPREEMWVSWGIDNVNKIKMMPDDAILSAEIDERTAIITLSHDPKLDDMALLEALKTKAFYIGAVGSRLTTNKRKERLLMFDLSAQEIEKLHAPVGLDIRSKTPPEIAVAILAEIINIKNSNNITSPDMVCAV